MRRLAVASVALASIAAGCTPAAPESTDAPVNEAQTPISWGNPDNAGHPAVVALLIPEGGGAYSECSGSIVKQANGFGYVLTAAHCCYQNAPRVVTTRSDYASGMPSAIDALFGAAAGANVYKVDVNSVYFDSQFNINALGAGHDFCMLKFPTSTTLSVLALPTSGSASDGVGVGVDIEHVGYGTTNTSINNSVRNKGTNKVSQLDNTLIIYDQGGSPSNHVPGTCQGDSGGPALVPAGVPQAQQTVIGVTSFGGADAQGNPIPCGDYDQGGADRVRAGIGPGKFITSYLNDTPIGSQPGTTVVTCDSCQQDTLSNGACASTYNACANNNACSTLITCLNNCTTQTCGQNCWNAAGTTGQTLYTNIINCICDTGCSAECATDPLCAQPQCGFQVTDTTCNSCMESSCCNQALACDGNATCLGCLSNPVASCNNNTPYKNLINCLGNNCSSECGISSSSSSSSSSTSGSTSSSSSSSSSSGSASSSSGSTSSSSSTSASSGSIGTGGAPPGTGGAGGAPTGTTTITTTTTTTTTAGEGGSGNDPNEDSGCSVSGEGAGSDPGKGGSLALLVGAAIAFVRRRKNA